MKKAILILTLCFCACVWSQQEQAPKTLLDQEVVVVRSDFKDFHFRVPEGLVGEWVIRGMYQTKGGFNDDITFLAFNQENYVRWFSHYKYEALVKDEKKTGGNFQFAVTPGDTYYFVLYNFFSTVSNKRVRLRIELVPKP
jgi:hypothetical protein